MHWNTFEGEHLGKVVSPNTLERGTIDGDSPVGENHITLLVIFLSTTRNENLVGSWQDYAAKAKYYPVTDSAPVP